MGETSTVGLTLSGAADVDAEELQRLALSLRASLLELDVDDVRLGGAPHVPGGAKPGDAITVGALVITLAPLLVQSALQLIGAWMESRPVRSVSVTMNGRHLELGHASRAERQQLIEAFLADPPAED